MPPFALRFEPDAHAADIVAEFEGALEPGEESDRHATLAGRVVLARRMGKLTFLVLRDATGDLQLFAEEASLDEPSRALLDEIDLGDIVGAAGHVVRTRRGELSLKVETLTMLDEGAPPAAGEVARARRIRTSSSAGATCTWRPTSRPGARRWRARRSCARSARSSTDVGSSRWRRPCCSRSPAARTRARSPRTTTRSTWT